ncbi:hypothetical protein ACRS8V_07355 [Staphylococcus epidermidis]
MKGKTKLIIINKPEHFDELDKAKKNRGYAIKNEIVKELGFDFSNSHNPYSDY